MNWHPQSTRSSRLERIETLLSEQHLASSSETIRG